MPVISVSTKAMILGDLWLDYRKDIKGQPNWEEFFAWADIALPLSFMISKGYAQGATADGKRMIEDSWKVFCEMIEIDPEYDYRNVADCFERSPHPEI